MARLAKWTQDAWAAFAAQQGAAPFRRSDLEHRLYPKTRPRSHPAAQAIADALLRHAAASGEIVKHGHLHWQFATTVRTLKSGRAVPVEAQLITLSVNTCVPRKYVLIDLETGHVWEGAKNWKAAGDIARQEAASILQSGIKG